MTEVRAATDADAGEVERAEGIPPQDIDAFWLQRRVASAFPSIDAAGSQALAEQVFEALQVGILCPCAIGMAEAGGDGGIDGWFPLLGLAAESPLVMPQHVYQWQEILQLKIGEAPRILCHKCSMTWVGILVAHHARAAFSVPARLRAACPEVVRVCHTCTLLGLSRSNKAAYMLYAAHYSSWQRLIHQGQCCAKH